MTDYEAIDKAIRAKASPPMNCPVCGENSWVTPDIRFGFWPLDPPIDVSLEGDADKVEADAGFCAITCTNCGYVRLFHVSTLLDH